MSATIDAKPSSLANADVLRAHDVHLVRIIFYKQNLKWQTVVHKNKHMTQSVLASEDKKAIAKNLYLSGIAEEFIAMQLDLDTPAVIQILEEEGTYKKTK